ncbi:unnamed protein product [Ceutorhynchus assimilis]|uniref:Uncharacterized protein n=1 Tax=Ceutorhynchus assimilis TaxID=467358 RepID=A0A9N9MBI0_9CUCU|nr:unnamed protein product [Ceutorhynchus assimilis]
MNSIKEILENFELSELLDSFEANDIPRLGSLDFDESLLEHLFFLRIPQIASQQVAKEISTVFKKESEEIYFRPYKYTSQKCSGKLWSRYINVKKTFNELRKCTLETTTFLDKNDNLGDEPNQPRTVCN